MSIPELIKRNKSSVFRRLFIKRRDLVTGSYEADWLDVSSDVKTYGKVRQELDSIRLNQFSFGNMKINFENDSGRYNPHDSDFSLWYGYLNQQRTLVKVEAGFVDRFKRDDGVWVNREYQGQTLWDEEYWDNPGALWDFAETAAVFTGVISGDILLSDKNEVSFTVKPLSSVFEEFPAENLTGYNTSGMTAEQFMIMLRDQQDELGQYVFRPFFGDTTANWEIESTSNLYSLKTIQKSVNATNTEISISAARIYINGHGYKTGQAFGITTTGTRPAGVTDGLVYAIVETTTYFQIASTADNAVAGKPMTITDVGVGVHSFVPQKPFAVSGMTTWEVIEKLAEAENFVSFITPDGIFKFVSRAANSTATAFEFHGAGSFNTEYGHTIKEVQSFGSKVSKYYSRVFLKWQDTDAIDASLKVQSTYEVSPTSNPFVLGARTLEVENTFIPNTTTAQAIAQEIFDEFSVLKKEVEFTTSFVPHLKILDRISITYDPTEPSRESLWDLNNWAADDTSTSQDLIWDSQRGEAMIIRGQEFKFLSQEIDLDEFYCKFLAREV